MSKYYLTGPMTGIKAFNFPAFIDAAETLRRQDYEIVSPIELDRDEDPRGYEECLASPDGRTIPTGLGTWGDMLARDVKVVADDCAGVVLMPGWSKSRGARLEVMVALLCKKQILFLGNDNNVLTLSPGHVWRLLDRGQQDFLNDWVRGGK